MVLSLLNLLYFEGLIFRHIEIY